MITDADGVITYANQSVYDISGYTIDALIGQNPSIWKSGSHNETFYKDLWECILAGQPFRHVFINKKANSELFLLDNTISPIKDEQGTIKAFVSSGKDITKQKYLEDRLAYLAYYDPVTDMPNKSLFCDRLDMSIARIKHRERLVAIMIVGTDNFGMLIDTLGHDNTDKILVELACRLKGSVRDGDTVSRLGTNDFGLALNDIASKDDIPLLIEKIRSVLEKPIHVASEVFRVSTSIGISICPDDAQTVQELMRNAYLSLSQARRAGGNTFKFYSPEMNKMATEFVNMETRLLKALDNKGFVLHYQPYFDIASDQIKGAESLLRLKSDDLGLIMPARFIHVLEETGLIVKAGEWVLEEVIAQLGRWQLEGRALVPVTVNLSAVQFRTKDLCRCISSSMAAADVDPRILSFEITESAFIQDLDASVEAIDELKALGVNILIDDFGTAYSSLNYLSRFNVDYLKIDMSFIRGITTRKNDEAIVRAIIAMAHSLNMKTIAEGVETAEQLNILRHLECDMVQGFLFSKPIPPEDLAAKYLTGCF